MPIRVVLIDDHEVVRSGLVSLLRHSDVELVGDFASALVAEEAVRRLQPDLVLLDIRMPDGDGLDALPALRAAAPACRVVVLSTYDNPTYVARAQAAGAHDYLLKDIGREPLVAALRSAAAGEPPSPHGLLRLVAQSMQQRQKTTTDDIVLTQREAQILRHVALGLSNKEISQSLSISVETVKEHVQHVLRKTGVTDRTQAAVWAVRHGVV